MSIKKCMAKAGKLLDQDDRKLIVLELRKGKTDVEALDALEKNILIEQQDLIDTLSEQGIKVAYPVVKAISGIAPAQVVKSVKDTVVKKVKKAMKKDDPETDLDKRIAGYASEFEAGEKRLANFIAKIVPRSPLLARFLKSKEIGLTAGSLPGKPGSTTGIAIEAGGIIGDHYNAIIDRVELTGTDVREGGRKLDLNNEKDVVAQTEIVDHEIIHAYTTAYINKAATEMLSKAEKNNINYMFKAIETLEYLLNKGDLNLSDKATARLRYILGQPNHANRMAEFLSVMGAEHTVANEFYKSLSGRLPEKTMRSRIKALLESIKQSFLELTQKDLDSDIDADKLQTAILSSIAEGISLREQKADDFAKYRFMGNEISGINKQMPKVAADLNYLNYAVASMLNSKMEVGGKALIGNIHDKMKKIFPIYTDAANKLAGIYDESSALQQTLHSITGMGTDKTKKANILAKFSAVMASQTSIMNQQMGKFKVLLAPLSDKEKATIGRFVTEMPLHDYFVLASEIKTESAIADEVVRLEGELKKVGKKSVIKDIDDLIAWNVMHNEKSRGRLYSLEAGETQHEGQLGENARKLLALKSIQTIGSKDFESLLENTDLVNLLKDTSVANKLSLMENEGSVNLGDSMVMDYYNETPQLKAFTLSEVGRYSGGENLGWKILEMPEGDKLGIAYLQSIDSTHIQGAYTDIKLNSNDIDVSEKHKNSPGVVKTASGKYKLRLTKQNKMDLGLVEDFSHALVKSTAHNMAIQDSQIIRDELLKKDTTMTLGNNTRKLEDIVASDNVDNPWFIKLEEGVIYEKLPKEIRAKYAKVGKRASDVQSFNENVDLVRKDISHWLLGGSSKSLFQNPHMKWGMRIVKDLVAGAKIGMVVLNPIKIVNDNISNISYLSVMGIPPQFTAKNYKNIARDFQEYTILNHQIIQLKVKLVANPESTKIAKQIKSLQDRVSKTPIGDIQEKGFINSLGSDLVAKNADTLSGLQADMHTALEYLLTTGDGKKNYVSHFITQLHNIGGNGENFLSHIGRIVGKTGKMGKGMETQLDLVADRLKEIRTEDDIINYVSQYTTSPGSEAVRLGASITDLTDVLAKETLYRHLVENEGASPEAARIKVLDSFPDYKENMPLAIKELSDMGIIMFPSFWLRIQKVIYRMIRDKPINLATELMLEEAFGSNINTILDANIINKSNSFGGLLHTPTEPIGWGSFFPTYLFR